MSRSIKKGPFADASLLKKVDAQADADKTEDMVGHKLGEFVPTRTFHGHKSTEDKTTAQ